MTESITVEGKTLNEAIQSATSQLGAGGSEDIHYEFVREHFRGGAYTVQITAKMCDEQELAGRNAKRELAEAAREWMVECMESFGAEARVRSSLKGESGILVEVRCDEDGSLLIGKEGRNLQAFETLMKEHFADQPGIELTLDIEDYRSRSRAPRRDNDRGRGDDDRGRGCCLDDCRHFGCWRETSICDHARNRYGNDTLSIRANRRLDDRKDRDGFTQS